MNRYDFCPAHGRIRRLSSRVVRKAHRLFSKPKEEQPLLPPLLDQVPFARQVSSGPHHFFGYYDKCPWDITGKYLLAQEIAFGDRMPQVGELLTIGMIDLNGAPRFIPLDQTSAWCWQQGAMLQWLGTEPDRLVIYNCTQGDHYRSVVRDVLDGAVRILPRPVYAVSPDGRTAASVNFDRLHWLQAGYGYLTPRDRLDRRPCPDDDGIHLMDIETGDSKLIACLEWASANRADERFPGADHWFCHLQFNPSGNRLVFLHRWCQPGGRRWTRLYTCRTDGTDLRLLCDNGMVSHFDWRDDRTILAWSFTEKRDHRFQLFHLDTGRSEVVGDGILTEDGHCTYSPDRRWILNDTYPDVDRFQTLMLYNVSSGSRIDLLRSHAPERFTRECRCDLHPRWDRSGGSVCFDSTHSGTRQIYIADIRHVLESQTVG